MDQQHRLCREVKWAGHSSGCVARSGRRRRRGRGRSGYRGKQAADDDKEMLALV
jgi:hypothetical protein